MREPLHQIDYRDDRPSIDYPTAEALRVNGQTTPDFISKVIKYGFTRKAKSWTYEQEFRRFVWLHKCTMVGPHYFERIGLPPDRVVLGVRCRLTEADIVRAIISHQTGTTYDRSSVVRARLKTDSYLLDVPNAGR